jgi:hypothetical protein
VEEHKAVIIELSSVHLLGGTQFYQLPMRVKYLRERGLGEVSRLDCVF